MGSKSILSGLFGLSLLLLSTSVAKAESYKPEVDALDTNLSLENQNSSNLLSSNLFNSNFNNFNSLELTPKNSFRSLLPSQTPRLFNTKSTSTNSKDYQTNTGALGIEPIIPETYLVQSTNVSQMRDVAPNDWAYEALRSLVDNYGCIGGFPDQTFRGEQALSRYEFAAGLNSCLQQIERSIASQESVSQDDLRTIARLSQEFSAELQNLKGRVDSIDSRIGVLEDNQFSTTTVLNGEVIFAIADAFGGNPPGGCSLEDSQIADITGVDQRVDCTNADDPDTETTFSNLVRLGLETSFTGKDRLRTYLTSGSFDNSGYVNPESLNTYMATLSYQADLDNRVILDLLEYRFPVLDDKVVFSVIPEGFSLSNVLTSNSPYFDTGRGAISRFAEKSPIYSLGGVLNAGAGFDWLIADEIRLQAAYGTANSSDTEGGIFGADRSSLGVQLLLQPTESVVTGITYVNTYTDDGRLGMFTGSVNAESSGLWSGGVLPDPLISNGGIALGDLAAQTNAVGGTLQWRVTDKLTFGAWGGLTFTQYLDELPEFSPGRDNSGNLLDEPQRSPSSGKKPFGNAATYLFSLGVSDPLGREGDLAAFMFGMPPKLIDAGPSTQGVSVPFFETSRRGEDAIEVTDNNPRLNSGTETATWAIDNFGVEDEATSLHFEFLYRYTVNDHISITPGFFFVTNPGHIKDNDTLYVGTIRTTFRF